MKIMGFKEYLFIHQVVPNWTAFCK